jgi:hypothetical protein
MPPNRIAVLGCSGSGKSTLAAALALKFALPFVPTDPVFWTRDWKPTPAPGVQAWLAAATGAKRWVLDGNFVPFREIYWGRADLAVWLDPPCRTALCRVLRRNLCWWLSGDPVWNGKRMTLAKALGGAMHAFRTHGLKRRTYPGLLAQFPNLQVIRIRSRRDLEKWLNS